MSGLAQQEYFAGFGDPVHEAQACFRSLMEAMSRPGSIVEVDGPCEVPAPLSPVMASVALTLCDYETSIGLVGELRSDAVAGYLRFHTSAPVVDDLTEAAFVFLPNVSALPDLGTMRPGTASYPDKSATIVIDAGSFGTGLDVDLSGPGIETHVCFSATGLDAPFWRHAQANHERYPLGLDIIFCGPNAIAALPRSTKIEA